MTPPPHAQWPATASSLSLPLFFSRLLFLLSLPSSAIFKRVINVDEGISPLRCESVGGLKGCEMKEFGEMGEEKIGLEGGVSEEDDGVGSGRGKG